VSPQSRRLAEHVQQELVTGLPREYRPVADLGVKKGPFYVLFLSSMPSVLVESGFVTHAAEAKRLRDDHYVDALAEQIAEGLSAHGAAAPRSPRGRIDERLTRSGSSSICAREVSWPPQLPHRGARAPARAPRGGCERSRGERDALDLIDARAAPVRSPRRSTDGGGEPSEFCVVVVGGYARREMSIHLTWISCACTATVTPYAGGAAPPGSGTQITVGGKPAR
jgi:hypothetical protein